MNHCLNILLTRRIYIKKIIISFIILSLSFPILSANAARKRSAKSRPCPDTVRPGTPIAARCAGVTVVCPSAAAAGTSISARCISSGLTAICPRHSNNPSRACAYITQPIPSKDTTFASKDTTFASLPPGGLTTTPFNRVVDQVTKCFINEAQSTEKCTTCTKTCADTTERLTLKKCRTGDTYSVACDTCYRCDQNSQFVAGSTCACRTCHSRRTGVTGCVSYCSGYCQNQGKVRISSAATQHSTNCYECSCNCDDIGGGAAADSRGHDHSDKSATQ